MMDPQSRLADTTVVRLENERNALKRENARLRDVVLWARAVAQFGERRDGPGERGMIWPKGDRGWMLDNAFDAMVRKITALDAAPEGER